VLLMPDALLLVVVPALCSYLVRDRKRRPAVQGGVLPSAMPADRD
jgi:hypothetical protein